MLTPIFVIQNFIDRINPPIWFLPIGKIKIALS